MLETHTSSALTFSRRSRTWPENGFSFVDTRVKRVYMRREEWGPSERIGAIDVVAVKVEISFSSGDDWQRQSRGPS